MAYREPVPAPGVTCVSLGGGAFVAIADAWIEHLRDRWGDERAAEHFEQLYGPMGQFLVPKDVTVESLYDEAIAKAEDDYFRLLLEAARAGLREARAVLIGLGSAWNH